MALVAGEPGSTDLRRLLDEDRDGVFSPYSSVEVRSALARSVREGRLAVVRRDALWADLVELLDRFTAVPVDRAVLSAAEGILDAHPLRAADAVQLATAPAWLERTGDLVRFVALDRRLGHAAAKEGLPVFPSLTGEGQVSDEKPPWVERRATRDSRVRRRRSAALADRGL